ncbi:MAG: MarR family transcriptional regulator [Bacilli bacterium]|jgi:DNA-binding MarR family transcriptional regulator
MTKDKEQLNHFLVVTFNDILRYEERALERLANNRLSISEIHLLEAVFETMKKKENTSTNIASALGITLGSLTTAVKTLERKGYLIRERDQNDKRVFYLIPTPIATFVNKKHEQFHEEMIDNIVANLSFEEEKTLAIALGKVQTYFGEEVSSSAQKGKI